jgi:hypothetical protein
LEVGNNVVVGVPVVVFNDEAGGEGDTGNATCGNGFDLLDEKKKPIGSIG